MTPALTAAAAATTWNPIQGPRRRLLLPAPAVSLTLANATAGQWSTLPPEVVSVVLDLDPHVYRSGYSDPDGLKLLEDLARRHPRPLNRHRGISVDLLIADDAATLVYGPTSPGIDAGAGRPYDMAQLR